MKHRCLGFRCSGVQVFGCFGCLGVLVFRCLGFRVQGWMKMVWDESVIGRNHFWMKVSLDEIWMKWFWTKVFLDESVFGIWMKVHLSL